MPVKQCKLILLSSLLSFAYVGQALTAAPVITNLSPATGAIGTSVVITGTNFGISQGSSTVQFNGTTAKASSWSNTSISVTVPSGATTGKVIVTVSKVASNGKDFTIVAAPSASSLSIGLSPFLQITNPHIRGIYRVNDLRLLTPCEDHRSVSRCS